MKKYIYGLILDFSKHTSKNTYAHIPLAFLY